jgi:hypothetical protein
MRAFKTDFDILEFFSKIVELLTCYFILRLFRFFDHLSIKHSYAWMHTILAQELR